MPKRAMDSYGGLGGALLRALASEDRKTFTVADAREIGREVGVSEEYLYVLLHRLERSGWIHRLKRGTYALAPALPGVPEVHPFAVAMALIDPCAVSGWAALSHHGLTEQIPDVITLTTPKRVVTPSMRGASSAAPSTWKAAGHQYEIVTVIPAHFYGVEQVWVEDAKVRIFDRERALLDCFVLPRRFGGLAEGLGLLEGYLLRIDVPRLVAHARHYGKDAVAWRVGWALERLGVAPTLLEPLRTKRMLGYRPLDPGRARRGRRDPRWHVVENLSEPRNRP